MAFPLTSEQKAVVDDRGGALLVSAAAGSGKTRVLVERLLTRVADEGRDVDEFLVITFTNAAAGELRGRISKELGSRLAEDPGNPHLRRQTTLVYKAQISTIHSLCIALVREFGHLLDLDPDWRLCDSDEAELLRLRALDRLLDARYTMLEEAGETEAARDFSLLVDTLSIGRDDARLQTIVLDTFAKLQSHRDPEAWLAGRRALFALEGVEDAGETIWGRLLLDEVGVLAHYWAARFDELALLCDEDEQLTNQYLPSIEATAEGLRELARRTRHSWDAAASYSVDFPAFAGVRNCSAPDTQARIKAVRALCKKRMGKAGERLDGESATLLSDLRTLDPVVRGLFDLVSDFSAEFRAEKTRRGVLDFGDLEHLAVRLLTDGGGAPTDLARQVSKRWAEVMVDEYQDTNEVQNALVTALSQQGGNLFLVGDVRQSIYRFRLAEPGIFLEKYRAWRHAPAADGAPRKIILSKNFRSRPEILEAVNDLFSGIMSTEFGEMDYGREEYLYPGATYPDYRAARITLAVIDLDSAAREDGQKPDKDLTEARYVARQIRDMLDGGFPVSEGDALRPVAPDDFAILLRSPKPVLHHYIRALSELGIAWQAEGRADFFGSGEVSVALSFLEIIDNPRQDVPLIAVLRSPACGFSADRLAALRTAAPEGDFYTALRADDGADCAAFLGLLDTLRFGAADRASHQLLWELFEQTNLLGLYAALDGGAERRGNLLALYELARQFEAGGHRGLFGFLNHLRRLMEAGKTPGAPGGIGTPGGVSICSVHKSKGLEYPVVLLSGLGRNLNRQDESAPMLFHKELGLGPKGLDAERMLLYPTLARRAIVRKLDGEMLAEELRLLYVAMTRARERLIMTCGARAPELKRLALDAVHPADPQTLAAARSVGQWVLLHALCRPEGAALRAAGESDLLPMPRERFGTPWEILWEPGTPYEDAPTRSAPSTAPTRHAEEADGETIRAALKWRYPHMVAGDTPSKLTATQLKGRNVDQEVADETPPAYSPRPFRRPNLLGVPRALTAAERGAALHLVLQFMDFTHTDSRAELRGEIDRLAARQVVTPEQAAAADEARLLAFFQSDLGRAVKAADPLNREFKFSLLTAAERYYPDLPEGERVLLQGVVDCWFDTPDGIVVLDFKTDRVTHETAPARAAEYRPQLAAYADALTEMTRRPISRRVLWFFAIDSAYEV